MKHCLFTGFLTSRLGISHEVLAPYLENCTTRIYKREEYLLQENEQCRHTFFVEKGLLRQYSIDKAGKEHILLFAPEGWFVTDRQSVYCEQPAAYYIQALEDSEVTLITKETIAALSEAYPAFTELNNKLLHNNIRHLQDRVNMLLSASGMDRYLQFVQMYPKITQRVPQKMIAAYLGMTPESLSRVRRELTATAYRAGS